MNDANKSRAELYPLNLSDLSNIPAGAVLRDWFDRGVWCLILRGPSSLTAYVGIPLAHPLAGFAYDDIGFLTTHGGLTFGSGEGDGNPWPKGYSWYGWDYAHSGDKVCFSDTDYVPKDRGDHAWTISEVAHDVQNFLFDFTKLMRLAEWIQAKAKGGLT